MLRNCLGCGTLYRVRDPGASRRASLKQAHYRCRIKGILTGDPGDSRRASLKHRRRVEAQLLRRGVIPRERRSGADNANRGRRGASGVPGFQVVGDIGPALPRRPRRPVSLSPKAAADLFCSEQGCRGSLRRGHGPKQVRTTPVIRSCPWSSACNAPFRPLTPGSARPTLARQRRTCRVLPPPMTEHLRSDIEAARLIADGRARA